MLRGVSESCQSYQKLQLGRHFREIRFFRVSGVIRTQYTKHQIFHYIIAETMNTIKIIISDHQVAFHVNAYTLGIWYNEKLFTYIYRILHTLCRNKSSQMSLFGNLFNKTHPLLHWVKQNAIRQLATIVHLPFPGYHPPISVLEICWEREEDKSSAVEHIQVALSYTSN